MSAAVWAAQTDRQMGVKGWDEWGLDGVVVELERLASLFPSAH